MFVQIKVVLSVVWGGPVCSPVQKKVVQSVVQSSCKLVQ